MKIIFTCHTEYDLKNKFGPAQKNKQEEQSFNHIFSLIKFTESLKVPITFSLMIGGAVGDNLLRFIKEKNIRIPNYCEKSIHYHAEIFDRLWKFDKHLTEKEIINYFKTFQKTLGENPTSVVFGKWLINKESLSVLRKLGIEIDGSGTGKILGQKFIIKAPFYFSNILEIPVVCDGKDPVNPFSRLSNFFLIRKIIKEYHQENLILHIAFHSYDFFRFNREAKIRLIKKIIFRNILRLARKYNIEIVNLSEIKTTDFQSLDSLRFPFLSKVFRSIGH